MFFCRNPLLLFLATAAQAKQGLLPRVRPVHQPLTDLSACCMETEARRDSLCAQGKSHQERTAARRCRLCCDVELSLRPPASSLIGVSHVRRPAVLSLHVSLRLELSLENRHADEKMKQISTGLIGHPSPIFRLF